MKKSGLGILYFDGRCALCRGGAERLGGWLARRGIGIAPFPEGPGIRVPDEMRLRCHDGREFGGADAALVVVSAGWWGKPLGWLGRLPGVYRILVAGYRWVARNRYCLGGSCEVRRRKPATRSAFTPAGAWWLAGALVLLAFAGGLAMDLVGWLRMWLLAVALWVGFKVLALATTAADRRPRGGGWIAYALWPGMDAAAFGNRRELRTEGGSMGKGAVAAGARVVVGVWLIAGLAGQMQNPVAAGWCGMAGLVLVLHFGLFDWLALFWRRVGYDVERLMEAPWRARSLADFWGARWNRAFSHVANRALFRPLTRRFGPGWGTMAGFGLSGLAHELVISVPAGAGYGLPTAYFLVQGVGVLAERGLGWRGTLQGRLVMAVVVLAPAFWLFHPAFMTGVVAPMLRALGVAN
ncbi:hypothetical protein BH23VER1_BH23VER1_03490 [soil metagenome]